MEKHDQPRLETRRRRPWETPVVKEVGTLAQLLEAGGGKISINTTFDPGDPPFKPSGHE
jgi:hypothetical protein